MFNYKNVILATNTYIKESGSFTFNYKDVILAANTYIKESGSFTELCLTIRT